MKKFLNIILVAGVMAGVFSCQNSDWEFDDFDYTTTYFPYQTPLRTLVLDETYEFDNTNDMNLKFLISAAMGGVYENTQDIMVRYQVDNSLADGLLNGNGEEVMALPESYYSILNTDNTLIIPKGELSGAIEIQLTDEFLNDSMTVDMNYVIPVRLVSSNTDSILSGRPIAENPDIRDFPAWQVAPKNFTLFGIKYVNKYHGTYLLRGASEVRNINTDTLVDNFSYRQNYVVNDEVVDVNTIYKNSVVYSNELRLTGGSPGTFDIVIAFDDNDNGTITEVENSAFEATGSASWVADGDTWGGQPRNAIYLDYVVNDGTNLHNIQDTLVFRDKNVIFEEFEYSFE